MAFKNFVLTDQNRKEVCSPHFIKNLDLKIHFLIAVPQDFHVILDYYEEVAYKLKPVDKASKISPVEFREYYVDQIEKWLSNPFTILAVDIRNNSICGLISGIIEPLKEQKKRPLKFEKDYGKKVLEGEGPNYPVKLLNTFFGEIQSSMPYFFPFDCNEFMRIVGLVVSPEFQGAGIASKLWKELLRLALNTNIEYVTSTSTSQPSFKIASKFGMKSVFNYKYADFLCDGVPAFDHTLLNGTTELQLMIGNLKEIKYLFNPCRSNYKLT